MVYRCAIVVEPQKAFYDWLSKVEGPPEITLIDLQMDCNVYLVPDYEDEDNMEKAIEKYLKSNYAGIFLNELEAWYVDEKMFPKLTYETFSEWFKISTHTNIFDMVNQPLDKED